MKIHLSYENDTDKMKILKVLLPVVKKEFGSAKIKDGKPKADGKKHFYITVK